MTFASLRDLGQGKELLIDRRKLVYQGLNWCELKLRSPLLTQPIARDSIQETSLGSMAVTRFSVREPMRFVG